MQDRKRFPRWLLGVGLMGGAATAVGAMAWHQWKTPDASHWVAAADAARQQGSLKEAVIHYKSALQLTPEDLPTRWHLGQTYLALNQPAAALSELSRAEALAATTPAVSLDLAQAQIDLGRYAEANATLESYRGPRTPELDAMKVKAKLGLGHTAEAKILLAAAQQNAPDAASLDVATARLALSQRDISGASAALDKALATSPKNLEALTLKARIALSQGNLTAALSGFETALALAPEDLEALAGLAQAQIGTRQLEAASASVTRLKHLAPKSTEVLLLSGMLAYAREDWAQASSTLAEFVNLQPRQPQALLMLAGSHFRQGDFHRAEALLTTLTKLVPDHDAARKLLAVVLLKQHRGSEAVEALSPLLNDPKRPADAGLLALLSHAYAASGDSVRARSVLKQAQSLAPDHASAVQTQLATAQFASGNPQGGLAALNKVAEQSPENLAVRQTLTSWQVAQGDAAAALESARMLVELAPGEALSHNLAGLAYARAGKGQEASAAFAKALALKPDFAPALANQGFMALGNRQDDVAQAKLEAALKADKAYTPAVLALVALKDRKGDTAGATTVLNDALATQPDEPELRWQLAEHQLRAGERESARNNAEQAFKQTAASPLSQLRWGTFQLRLGAAEDAFKTLSGVHAAAPNDARITYFLAESERATQRYKPAREHYEAALKTHPGVLPMWWSLFATELADRQYAAAGRVVARMRQQFPTLVDADSAAGELATAQDQRAAATTAFRTVFKAEPSTRALLRLVTAQRAAKDMDGARNTLSEWLGRYPDDVMARLTLGALALDTKDWPAAQEAFEKVLETVPDQPLALNNLAWLYDRQNDPRALPLAERAHQKMAGDPNSADTLGWILVRKQRVQQGLALLEGAHKARPDDPNVAYHYAYALAEAGMKDKARATAEALLAKGLEFESQADTRTLLLTLRASKAPGPYGMN